MISTHTLTWSVTRRLSLSLRAYRISTHTLTWSVTMISQACWVVRAFQLTRSRGAWRHCSRLSRQLHQFQLTRSRGAWRSADTFCFWFLHFNSHAHVERDGLLWQDGRGAYQISTHTLTWSVTFTFCMVAGSLSFQLTRSRGAWRRLSLITFVVAVFQLTRSRGAWRSVPRPCIYWYYFNSHAHVERDSAWVTQNHTLTISTHTLTWSVTWYNYLYVCFWQNFNSHAHVERDIE